VAQASIVLAFHKLTATPSTHPHALSVPEAVSELLLRRIKSEAVVSTGGQLESEAKPRPSSYSSALLNESPSIPPATNTLPEGSSVAVCNSRPAAR